MSQLTPGQIAKAMIGHPFGQANELELLDLFLEQPLGPDGEPAESTAHKHGRRPSD